MYIKHLFFSKGTVTNPDKIWFDDLYNLYFLFLSFLSLSLFASHYRTYDNPTYDNPTYDYRIQVFSVDGRIRYDKMISILTYIFLYFFYTLLRWIFRYRIIRHRFFRQRFSPIRCLQISIVNDCSFMGNNCHIFVGFLRHSKDINVEKTHSV